MFNERNELVTVVGEPVWWDPAKVEEEEPAKRQRRRRNPVVVKYLPTVVVLVLFGLAELLTWKTATDRATKKTEERMTAWHESEMQAYIAEQEELKAAEMKAEDLFVVENEAEWLARVLYGIKSNSTDDLKTCCWCVFNRVDSPGYPNTVQEVVNQPQQWMAYKEDNPVLEDLYQIAYDQLTTWYSGGRRPVSAEFVFMSWSPTEIVLRDNWKDGSSTHYWRYK